MFYVTIDGDNFNFIAPKTSCEKFAQVLFVVNGYVAGLAGLVIHPLNDEPRELEFGAFGEGADHVV